MNRFARLFLLLSSASLGLVLFSGCNSVKIPHPLPAGPQPVNKNQFEGAWLGDKEIYSVKFDSEGVGRFANTTWNGKRFVFESGSLVFTQGKSNNYVSLQHDTSGTNAALYNFLKYDFTPEFDLLLWAPNKSAFEQAVKSGRLLAGPEDDASDSIVITNSPQDLLDFLESGEMPELFEESNPLILLRL